MAQRKDMQTIKVLIVDDHPLCASESPPSSMVAPT